MTHYRSFAEQALHYFIREHEAVPGPLADDPAAWRGPDMASRPDAWQVQLNESEIAEIGSAADRLMGEGVPMGEVTQHTFAVPSLAPKIAAWRDQLKNGLGFLVLRALPVRAWGEEKSAYAYWGLGHHIGVPGAQNPANELLGHVKDYGEEADNPAVRRYRTAGNIDFHCDAADVVGLMCLQPAKAGGQSRIASSVTIYNEIAGKRPDLAARLFQPFHLDLRGEHKPGARPVNDITPCAFSKGRLSTFWHSDYFHSADRHAGIAFSEEEKELMALYDGLAASPAIHLDMWLEVGDMQFISNHTIVHARTAYEDWPEAERRRHLLRLWLSLD